MIGIDFFIILVRICKMSNITKFIRRVAESKRVFIFIVLLLIAGVFMENLIFLYIVTFIFVLLIVIDTVNWESVKWKMQ